MSYSEKDVIDQYRYFLKDHVRLTIDFRKTDQRMGFDPPPVEKELIEDADIIALPPFDQSDAIHPVDLVTAIHHRKSHRVFVKEPLTLEEISFLLWATQGVRDSVSPGRVLRTVPSAGCRHSFETYLCVLNVENLNTGIYRYLPIEHKLIFEKTEANMAKSIVKAALHQSFVGHAALSFVWTTIPYRMEWRYDRAAHKVIAIDVGHVCQNLYLATSAINAGTCAIAAYNQELMDRLLGVDGEDEFTIYMAAVGKLNETIPKS